MSRKKSSLRYLLPSLIVVAIIVMIGIKINDQRSLYFSSVVNEKLPDFKAPDLWLKNEFFTPQDFKGKVVLLNVWASWCPSCRSEHQLLMDIHHQGIVPIYSLVYKDEPSDARDYLLSHGNPYTKSGLDDNGKIVRHFRVYGTPETFLIDKKGIIRYRQIGVMDDKKWQNVLLPLVNQYKMEK